ncbi:MAG: cell division protein FtsA, partial [Pseudomonadota bacterium]
MTYNASIRGKRQRIVTALDIGTSKVCCLIGKTSTIPDWADDGSDAVQFDMLGLGHTRAEGLKAGMVTHLDSAERSIRAAVDSAER